jgi:hypothetical protein
LILVQLSNVGCTDIFQFHNILVLFIVLILVQLTNVSCFFATCASVAITVSLAAVASVLLAGTAGLVQNVLLQFIVSAQVVCTTSLLLAFAHKALLKSTWSDNVPHISPQSTQVIYQALLFNSVILSLGCNAVSALPHCVEVANSDVLCVTILPYPHIVVTTLS